MAQVKNEKLNPYAIARQEGTAALEAFLAGTPAADDIRTLLQIYVQNHRETDRVAAMKLLLAQPTVSQESLALPLRQACALGHAETVALILAHPKRPPLNDPSESSLCEAALTKQTACALLLLEAGADPNIAPADWPAFTKDLPAKEDGPSPLLNTIRGGDPELIRALIAAKVDLNAKTRAGRRPLDVALALGQTTIAALLVEAGAQPIPPEELDLNQATDLGYRERVAQLLDAEKVDQKGRDHLAARAARAGQLPVIELLFERGLSEEGRYSVLQEATSHDLWDLVTPLLAMGAPASNPKKEPDQSPLLVASFAKRWDIVLQLLTAGADPRMDSNAINETSLLTAVRQNRLDMVDALLAAGANPNAKTESGSTPLSEARANGLTDIVKRLQAKGAKTKTPAQLASAIKRTFKPLSRTCWRPLAKRALANAPDDRTSSRTGGLPYMPPKQEWPRCGQCTGSMSFAAQLELAHLPKEHPAHAEAGLVQLFFCTACDQGRAEDTTHLVRRIDVRGPSAPIQPPQGATIFPRTLFGEWKATPDLPYREPGLAEFDRLAKDLPSDEELRLFSLNVQGDKAGGWPNWVQDNAYPSCPECRSPMRTLLLQLGSQGHLAWTFGDNGVAWIFQCESHEQQLAFTWQCA